MANTLSEAQAYLAECLKFLKISRDAIVTILLLVPNDDQIAAMAEYILENPKAAEEQILKKAMEISEL